MKAYYGSRISENIVQTPEGYLICKNAPIARTGAQDYLRSELGMDGKPGDIVQVLREEAEVFSPATIASFEGKPVTYDHPPDGVDVQNITAYDCGHVQNVRRGVGDESDLLVADLFITSSRLIEAVRDGLREISCGYDADYTQDEAGNIYQRGIRGNHVAVVPAGRAGSRVAIKDSATESPSNPTTPSNHERSKRTMAKRNQNSLMARLFSRAVKDMEPDEVADAIEEIAANSADEEPAQAPAPATDAECGTRDDPMQALEPLLTKLISLLEANTKLDIDEEPAPAPAPAQQADEGDPLTQLVQEIATQATAEPTPADQEAAATIPADELPDSTDEEPTTTDEEEPTTDEDGPVAAASTLPENPIPGADRAAARYALGAINAVRPIIAQLPPRQRKAAADRAAAEIRRMMGKPARARSNGYAGINATMRQASKARAKDSRPKADSGELGKRIMASRNPHYKNKT